jgi:hypothetical protein
MTMKTYKEYQLSSVARGPKSGVYARIAEARKAEVAEYIRQITAQGAVEISGYPGFYVSPGGRVFSTAKNHFRALRPGVKPGGYEFVGIGSGANRKYRMVHRLVAEAFLPNPQGLPEVNHIDGNKRHNNVRNLEWISRSGNIQHALRTGLAKKGLDHAAAKLTMEQVIEIRMAPGRYRDIGATYGVCAETVSRIKNSAGPYEFLAGPTNIRPRICERARLPNGRLA